MKRKGNLRFKKIKGYRNSKMGIVDTHRYVRNEKPYDFKLNTGGKLGVFALNKPEAIKKAKSWERWLKRTGRGNDKVVF